MNIGEATIQLFQSLRSIYDESEASQITDWVMESLTGMNRSGRIINKEQELSGIRHITFSNQQKELLAQKPVQYVLHEAWFCGMKFYVDEQVLIPRPETEELVSWIAEASGNRNPAPGILDIGSGSGCIPVVLKKKMPLATITSIDVCSEALSVAVNNAVTHETEIDFRLLDFLDETKWNELGSYDIIVSNPPYITRAEKDSIKKNVLDHEPHLALFVNEDPLIFYRKIAAFGKLYLKEQGSIFAEINETLGRETSEVFEKAGYSTIELKKDMQGKTRMIRAAFH